MLGGKRFLRTIRVRDLLSFGPESSELELLSLNVLIGPNGAGKSNLIEVVSLLHASPSNLLEPIQWGGGMLEWMWKGPMKPGLAEIDATITSPTDGVPLRHVLRLMWTGQVAGLGYEAVEDERPKTPNESEPYFYYRNRAGQADLRVRLDSPGAERTLRQLRPQDVAPGQSVVSQRKDPDQYPEITYLGSEYARIRIFREWNLGRNAPSRRPQPTDLPADYLQEDAANLSLVLNDLQHRTGPRGSILERLRNADPSIADLSTRVLGGTIQLYVHYEGLVSPVPATRLSDGTFRYLCLLAVLCHPDPPPLICLEEPELGLHPDLLPGLADLLVEASHRTQLIVTTHSDVLVDGLSRTPEAVIVCEKKDGVTRMARRTRDELAVWLKDYGLGQLWLSGELGGNRY